MPIIRNKRQFLEYIANSINDGGYNVLFIETTHPFLIKVYNESESYLLRVYIWNLTHGGGRARAVDEYRIQITGIQNNQFVQNQDEITLILGWWNEIGVFAAFDYYKHNGRLGNSPSIQIREQNLRNAVLNGFSAYDRGNGEVAIAFRPDFFMEYIKNIRQLHLLGDEHELSVVERVVSGEIALNNQAVTSMNNERQTVLANVYRKLRDNSFKNRVLTSYSNRCAFSGMQLKLIDAAHILPVSVQNSTDETSNGIALSALYHRAFDRGLVTINEQYQIIINEEKIDNYRQLGLDGGIETFRANLLPMILVPPSIGDRPNVEYIRQSNELRGWHF